MKLDLGSQAARYKDYMTVDKYAPEADIKADVCDLPFKSNSITDIWASHILEHLKPLQVQPALKEWKRVLVPGGRCQIALPDLDDACRAWLERRPGAQSMIYGGYDGEGQFHYLGWGALELRDELRAAGFHITSVQSFRETADHNLGGSYWHNMVNLFAEVRKPL